MRDADLLHEFKVACCVLLFSEDSEDQFSGGIVDSGDKSKSGAAIFQPGMGTTIQL
jgi:hypothetical protein